MSTEQKPSGGYSFSTIIKNIFWVLLVIQLATVVVSNMKNSYSDVTTHRINVGSLSITGQVMESGSFVKHLHEFIKDDSVKGILIKIDSGGGAAGSGQALYEEIYRCKKPVVVYVENMCGSTAYYAAIAADHIIATGTSIVGSVGALISAPNVKGLLDSIHVQINDIHSGDFKTVGSSTNEFTDADRAYLKAITDDSYDQFIHDVAQCRDLDLAKHFEWANGRMFTGRQACAIGLIDEVGSYSDALKKMRELLNTEEELYLIKPHQQTRLMRILSGDADDDTSSIGVGSWCGQFLRSAVTAFSSQTF